MARAIEKLELGLEGVVRRDHLNMSALCPAHSDSNPSLSVTDDPDHGKALIYCHAGCEPVDIVNALGMDLGDLYDEDSESDVPMREVARYKYRSAERAVIGFAMRKEGRAKGNRTKTFVQAHYDDHGSLIWKKSPALQVTPYRLPELLDSIASGDPVWVVEGEKDADRLAELGYAATCNIGGGGKWRPEHAAWLKGAAEVVVVADNDGKGAEHATTVKDTLTAVLEPATPVRVVRAAVDTPKADVSDHLDAGKAVADLVAMTDEDLTTLASSEKERAQDPEGGVHHADAVAREADRIRVREAARALVNAERAGGVSSLPEPVTLTHSLTLPSEYTDRWRVKGILQSGGNASLTAVRKVGKTVTGTNLVRSLVDGHRFLDRFEVIPVDGTVAFSNYEVSREQFDQWVNGQNIKRTDAVVQFPFRGHRVPLMTDDGMEWMTKRLRNHDAEVWIVDPFSAAFNAAGGLQENDNSEVRRFLERLTEIKTAAGVGEIVLTVHGSRGATEGAERSRAASALEDWPDALWQLNMGEDGNRYFKIAAGRDVAEGEHRLELDVFTNRLIVAGGTRREAKLEPVCADVIEFVSANQGATTKLITDTMTGDLGHSRTSVRDAMAKLSGERKLRVEKGDRTTLHHFAETN